MLSSPRIILIGAAGRNVGKTEFACALIRRHSGSHSVVAVKITSVTVCDGSCPRGGMGCGVCSSLKGDFELSEERAAEGGKDTARMGAAGAQQVWWLRVRREALAEGLAALLARIPADALVVCESNSAREALMPGLFLVIREQGHSAIKESCARVIERADRILEFDGQGWTLDPSQVVFREGRWEVDEKEILPSEDIPHEAHAAF